MNLAEYFEDTGNTIRWIKAPHIRATRLIGRLVVGVNGHGYLQVALGTRRYQVHRVLWELRNGPVPPGYYVDHADGNKTNNLPSNLRLARAAQNSHNARLSTRNRSGVKGLSYSITRDVWVGAIHCRGKAYKFQSTLRSTVEDWLHVKRRELHAEFTNYGDARA